MLAPGILNLFMLLQSRYTNLKSGAFQTVQSYAQWTEYNVCLTHLAWMLALKLGILGNAFLKLIFIHKKFLFRYTMRKVYAPLARHKQKWDKSCSLYVQKERLCLRDFSCHSLSPNLVKTFLVAPLTHFPLNVNLCRFMLHYDNLRNTEKVFDGSRETISRQIYFTILSFKNEHTKKCGSLIAITVSTVVSRNVRENRHLAVWHWMALSG